MQIRFENKNVIITGAGSGIGRETALKFASAGATVVVADINDKGGKDTVGMIEAKGGKASFVQTNVANHEEVCKLIEGTVSNHGSVDIAVNNAGVGGKNMFKTAEHTHDDWHDVIAVNQTGVFYCMQEELKQMMAQGGGTIVNIASIAGIRGLPNSLSYVASKHAVVGMTRTAAMEYAKYGIRINAVCPVFTLTNMFDPSYYPDQVIPNKLKSLIPMKRFSKPQEMADAIVYLSSDNASFITGHALPVDGGLTA